jgi:hypothetical protein
MLIEEKEDKGDKEDYRRNFIAKPDHGLEQPQEICKEPTRQEIRHAIQRMRNNGSSGRLNCSGINKIWRRSNGCSQRINQITMDYRKYAP